VSNDISISSAIRERLFGTYQSYRDAGYISSVECSPRIFDVPSLQPTTDVLCIILRLPLMLLFSRCTLLVAVFPRRNTLGSIERVALISGGALLFSTLDLSLSIRPGPSGYILASPPSSFLLLLCQYSSGIGAAGWLRQGGLPCLSI